MHGTFNMCIESSRISYWNELWFFFLHQTTESPIRKLTTYMEAVSPPSFLLTAQTSAAGVNSWRVKLWQASNSRLTHLSLGRKWSEWCNRKWSVWMCAWNVLQYMASRKCSIASTRTWVQFPVCMPKYLGMGTHSCNPTAKKEETGGSQAFNGLPIHTCFDSRPVRGHSKEGIWMIL